MLYKVGCIDKLYTQMGKVFHLTWWELNLLLSCFGLSRKLQKVTQPADRHPSSTVQYGRRSVGPKEYISISIYICSRDFCPQKAGTRITAPLAAAWWTIVVGWREYYASVYTVGWVDFGLFSHFMHLHVFRGSPRYNTGKCQISLTFVQKPMRGTTWKVPI